MSAQLAHFSDRAAARFHVRKPDSRRPALYIRALADMSALSVAPRPVRLLRKEKLCCDRATD